MRCGSFDKMNLSEKRRAIRHLLDEKSPRDATAVKYAFYHPDEKTQLFPFPPDSAQATGYVAVCRTGMDLFRPFVTMRLPIRDMDASLDVIYGALRPGTAVIIEAPDRYAPLLKAVFDVHQEEVLRGFVLDRSRFEPVINVLVSRSNGGNGLPRFVVRRTSSDEVVASSGLNWQSLHFADISVNVEARYRGRGWGKSVVAAMVQYLLENGRTPLYFTTEDNHSSIHLAHTLGFIDSGVRSVMLQAVLNPRP